MLQEKKDSNPSIEEIFLQGQVRQFPSSTDGWSVVPSQYEVLEKVSEGGMGVIYRARHRFTDGLVAIKLLSNELSQDPEALKRFAFEAKAATSLEHPAIIKVRDFGVNEFQIPYIIMDWVDGIGMERKIKRDGPMNAEEAVSVVMQTARALAHAHEHNVIHRDLKPENLMLTRDEIGRTAVRVVDFGIAKALSGGIGDLAASHLTQTGVIMGSPYFMSPEQGLGRSTDARTDIYSLGCVMYFALMGELPYYGGSCVETIFQHVNDPIPELRSDYRQFPEALQCIINTAMAKEPNSRYQTMQEFADDLERFAAGSAVLATVKPVVRNPNAVSNLKLVALFLASFVLFYFFITSVQTLFGF